MSDQSKVEMPMSPRTAALLQRAATAVFRLAGALPESVPLLRSRAQVDLESQVFGGAPIPMGSVEDITVAGTIPARRYRPRGVARPSALLVYFHGGGFVVGSPDSCDSVFRFLAEHAEVAVLSVDYRLAPEHPFPAAVDDAVAAFRWAVANATALGVDPYRIAVSGDSAGGNLAAVVAQVTAAGPAPAFQLLFFPCTDMATKSRSFALFPEGFFRTEAQIDWYYGHYLPDAATAKDPRASPLLAEHVGGLALSFAGAPR
ncbi:alpha/beta hydrolase [Pseudonocardia sp. GCM10023141]|uniref:alpha/beta hydrolase n=1 Tax=Pseudonocardia sp. GCM10023141 TaxID=3252653 RepID=UPI00360B4974